MRAGTIPLAGYREVIEVPSTSTHYLCDESQGEGGIVIVQGSYRDIAFQLPAPVLWGTCLEIYER